MEVEAKTMDSYRLHTYCFERQELSLPAFALEIDTKNSMKKKKFRNTHTLSCSCPSPSLLPTHTFLTKSAGNSRWASWQGEGGGAGRPVKWDGCDPTWLLPLKGWMFKSERGSGLVWMWYIPIPYIKLFFIIYSACPVPPSRRLPPSVHSRKLYGIIKVRKGDDRKKNCFRALGCIFNINTRGAINMEAEAAGKRRGATIKPYTV